MQKPSTAFDDATATDLVLCATPEAAFDRLVNLYDEALAEIEKEFTAFSRGQDAPADCDHLCDCGVGVGPVATDLEMSRQKVVAKRNSEYNLQVITDEQEYG